MDEIREYNESTEFVNEDKIQFSFSIAKKQGAKARRNEFAQDVQSGLSMFYSTMQKERVMKVSPVERQEFEQDKSIPDSAEYSREVLVGFPFRIGVVRTESPDQIKFRMGIKVQRFQTR